MTRSPRPLLLPPTVGGARLLGLGEYRPSRTVGNDELPAELHTSDEWIRTRTGITTRHVAGDDEPLVRMAAEAAGKALADAGTDAADVDLLLLATCSAPTPLPQVSPQVGEILGVTHAAALDLNAACSGFCSALALAADAIRAGTARTALVVGAERMTDHLDWSDRGTAILFGDGAGAVVVGASDVPGVGPVVWGADGSRAAAIRVDPDHAALQMDGQAVYRWATTAMVPVARQACELAGVHPRELAAVVPHQANLRIVEAVARGLGADNAVVARDVVTAANTSAASVPLALTALRRAGDVAHDDLALLVGFGAGLTWAAQVVRLP